MLARGDGHLVVMSSLAGRAATVGQSLYVTTQVRGCAASRARCARTCTGRASGVSAIFPGFIREAGMFHEAGVKLPPGVGTRSPEDVARAVVRAIERDHGQLDVAPLGLRAGSLSRRARARDRRRA